MSLTAIEETDAGSSILPRFMRDAGLVLSALCWRLAFLAYVVVYGPYLVNARIDGREG